MIHCHAGNFAECRMECPAVKSLNHEASGILQHAKAYHQHQYLNPNKQEGMSPNDGAEPLRLNMHPAHASCTRILHTHPAHTSCSVVHPITLTPPMRQSCRSTVSVAGSFPLLLLLLPLLRCNCPFQHLLVLRVVVLQLISTVGIPACTKKSKQARVLKVCSEVVVIFSRSQSRLIQL
jgi:hypothetical protein